jgi:hypothetical protein
MTQDSNRSAQVPWGQRPAPPPQPAWWLGALTVPGLLAHIVVMLGVSSVLTIINLLTGPRVWWSLAILVIWLALVIIHAIGVGSRTLLFDSEDAERAAPSTRVRGEPLGPDVPSWLSLPKRNVAPQVTVPESWELRDDTPGSAWTASTAQNGEAKPAPEPLPRPDDKVPWRAATDIAWLRRPKSSNPDDREPPAKKEASS